MKNLLQIVLLCVVLAYGFSASNAQATSRQVTWSGEGECVLSGFGSTQPDIECDSFYNEGSLFWAFFYDELTIFSTIVDDGDYVAVGIGIKNKTDRRITFLPENIVVSVKTSEKKDAKPQVLEYKSGVEIADSYRNRAGWANALGGFGAGVSNNPVDKVLEAGRASERNSSAARAGAAYIEGELRSTTIFPGSDASGDVYFKRKKGIKTGQVSISIDGIRYTYNFRMGK